MSSLEAMDHIDKAFLEITESTWLPQWSFDFWTIPYLLGRGYSLEQFRALMHWAHKLLALDIAYVPEQEKKVAQLEYLQNMVATSQSVEITAGGRSDGRAFEVSR